MSFKASGPKTRPSQVKPPPTDPLPAPIPATWTASAPSRRSSTSSITSFHSAVSGRFSPPSEQRMVDASHTLKSEANTLFSRQDYSQAISTYDRALAELPRYLEYEVAVLRSNIAACHLKLEQWKDAVEACERGMEGLEKEMPTKTKKQKRKEDKDRTKGAGNKVTTPKDTGDKSRESKSKINGGNKKLSSDTDTDSDAEDQDPADSHANDAVVELSSSEDEATALAALNLSDTRKQDIQRIRVKLLLRRARARTSMPTTSTFASLATNSSPDSPDSAPSKPSSSSNSTSTSTWSTLSAALEDYTLLHTTPSYWTCLPPSDRKTVLTALSDLPPRIDEAKKKEVSEMMGKLKDLGNSVLRPFGLSTDMFSVKQQGEGGAYSLSFDGGGKKG